MSDAMNRRLPKWYDRIAFIAAAIAVLWAGWPAPSAGPLPAPRERADLIVAKDGSGTFRTIQEALDAVPRDNRATKIVLVRNGTYEEKLYVRSSHVALVGEDRDRTRIVFAELRKNWRATHPDDWGAAVINVADDVTDLFLGNLTVYNNYGSLHGDNDHQFAIRSGGIATRITIVHARVLADGGDTLSLWNTGNGMYYHADCDFEGYVDYVCPRGWCYITNSRFFGRNLTASIWHDGSKDPDQKLVIRRSSFDGVPGFPLGRNNRDGQFFLLDNRFSSNMADRPIYRPSAPEAYQWPARVFFAHNRRDGGDFAWFADNLGAAEGQPSARDITPSWTFRGRWDPEGTMVAALPFASTPRPETGDADVPAGPLVLRWTGARNATKYRLSFGETLPAPFRAEVAGTLYEVGRVAANRTFHWRVDAVTPQGVVEGQSWTFSSTAPGIGGMPRPAPAGRAPVVPTPARPASAPSPWRVRIVVVGDSMATDEAGWGLGFRKRVQDAADCINLARAGRTPGSYLEDGLWQRALEARPDIVLVQFADGDVRGATGARATAARTSAETSLARYVRDAREAGATPVLVIPPARRGAPDANAARSAAAYAEVVRTIAARMGVALIDLDAKSAELAGGTASAIGSIVAAELVRVLPAAAAYVK